MPWSSEFEGNRKKSRIDIPEGDELLQMPFQYVPEKTLNPFWKDNLGAIGLSI
jgi:hypothetical protein